MPITSGRSALCCPATEQSIGCVSAAEQCPCMWNLSLHQSMCLHESRSLQPRSVLAAPAQEGYRRAREREASCSLLGFAYTPPRCFSGRAAHAAAARCPCRCWSPHQAARHRPHPNRLILQLSPGVQTLDARDACVSLALVSPCLPPESVKMQPHWSVPHVKDVVRLQLPPGRLLWRLRCRRGSC